MIWLLAIGWLVVEIAFSPDSQRILSTSEDGTARLWDARSGAPLAPPMITGKTVSHGLFSPDGRFAATACEGGPAQVWDALTGEPVTSVLPIYGSSTVIQFTQDSRKLIGMNSAGARVWTLPTETRDIESLQAIANLLSGQRVDAKVGTIPIDISSLRNSWNLLQNRSGK